MNLCPKKNIPHERNGEKEIELERDSKGSVRRYKSLWQGDTRFHDCRNNPMNNATPVRILCLLIKLIREHLLESIYSTLYLLCTALQFHKKKSVTMQRTFFSESYN